MSEQQPIISKVYKDWPFISDHILWKLGDDVGVNGQGIFLLFLMEKCDFMERKLDLISEDSLI